MSWNIALIGGEFLNGGSRIAIEYLHIIRLNTIRNRGGSGARENIVPLFD